MRCPPRWQSKGVTLAVDNTEEFFDKKRPWSRYKDLILDYYLDPYLAKVARLNRPILVVDCFAGPGTFLDGCEGSPLIIARHLSRMSSKSVPVVGLAIEKSPKLFRRLEANLVNFSGVMHSRKGDFREHINEIQSLSRDHTTFLYVDPIKPGHLMFDDLAAIYEGTRQGRSVETLVNFLSTGFVRRAQGLFPQAFEGHWLQEALEPDSVFPDELGSVDANHPQTLECNRIAGSNNWQSIVFDNFLTQTQKIELVAKDYCEQLRKWFQWVISYPIREKHDDVQPKYHLTFGSRHIDAIELMNRAMVTARREFISDQFVSDHLFPNQPAEEIISQDEIINAVFSCTPVKPGLTWKLLRVTTIQQYPCRYTEAEINSAIKLGIRRGRLASDSPGQKIVETAHVWRA